LFLYRVKTILTRNTTPLKWNIPLWSSRFNHLIYTTFFHTRHPLYLSSIPTTHPRDPLIILSLFLPYPPLPLVPPTHSPFSFSHPPPRSRSRPAGRHLPSLVPTPACLSFLPGSAAGVHLLLFFPFCFSPSRSSHHPWLRSTGLAVERCAPATSSTSLARGLAAPPHLGHDGRGSGVALRLPLSGGALLPKAAGREAECGGGARGISRWCGAGARSGLPLLTLSSSAAASALGRATNLGFPLLPMVGRGQDVAAQPCGHRRASPWWRRSHVGQLQPTWCGDPVCSRCLDDVLDLGLCDGGTGSVSGRLRVLQRRLDPTQPRQAGDELPKVIGHPY
jgi:hypothetical protein